MAAQFIYTMRDLKRFYPPDREVLRGINLSFYPGAKIGVIGSNGSGKSSLLQIMAGQDDGFTGEARLTPGFTVGYLAQEPQLDPAKTVAGNVADGVGEVKGLLDRFNEVCAAFAEPDADFDALLAEQSDLQTKIDAAGAWDLERTFEIAMDALRLPPGDADVTTLSGGERRRVALCRLLLSKPDLLLLDEPTNHLDAESVAWLERTLQEYPGTVVAVTHDRYFLDNVAGWILELDRGAGIPWEGNYSSWLEQKQARLAGEEKADRSRQDALQRELDWIRMSPRARQSKGKARITAYNELVAEAEAAERRADKVEITIPPGPRLGDRVVDAAGLVKGFGDRLLIDGLSFLLPPGGIVGIIGPNGAGKTTLFKMIVGEEKPDGGTLDVGSTVSLAYVDQSRDNLDGEATVFDEITGGVDRIVVGNRELHSRAYVASFGFKGSDQQKKVGQLSGGERNRVQLAKVLKSGGNVLLLDEPTNDLDVDTLARARRCTLGLPRVRRGHQPRPLVSRPGVHACARLRGRLGRQMVGGELHRLRGRSQEAARPRGRPAASSPLQAFGARLTGRDECASPVHHGAPRPVHVGGPTEPLEETDRVGGKIELARVHAVARRAWERVVCVVPGVAETEESQGREVGAAILAPERLFAECVAQRVGAPRDVMEQRDPDDSGPETGEERAPDGADDEPTDKRRDEEREHGPEHHRAGHEGEVGICLEIGAPPFSVDLVVDEEPAGVGMPEATELMDDARTLGRRRMGVAGPVRKGVVPAVLGDPTGH